ncbi:ATPK1 [Symbiodinium necroappetens]|uniref:non-specific serine/threonine protein kinase n=1 Tax=Symbiodinium necroappetens TaxID=1628268 RepID=A0A812UJ03_9DINO|nr:ATPK1 [Symbiodinium necroappetens]
MLSFVLDLHPSWAVCWAVSVVIYYLLFATYASRTKPGADLHSAVAYGEVDVLRKLLRSSELVLDISRFGPDGRNPLHLAARRGQVECMKLLVEEKADLQARTGNKKQHTALHLAAMNKVPDAVRFLCQVCRGNAQVINAGNADGDTPLHIAARFHNVEVLRELLRHPGVDVRKLNKQGLAAAECTPSDKFSFDHDSAECAIADMLRDAEATSRQAPRGSTATSETARTTLAQEALELSSLAGNRPSSGAVPAKGVEPLEQVVPDEEDPRPEKSQNVPLMSVSREAEQNFLRVTQGSVQLSVDAPMAVTNCGLSSFMLSAGLGAVSRFFLGSIAEDSDKGFNGSESPSVSIEDFAEMRMLGEGAFGKVVLVRHKETGELYVQTQASDPSSGDDGDVVRNCDITDLFVATVKYIRGLNDLRHPFIVQLHFAFQCSYFWALVMDFCPNGDLQGCLMKYGLPGLRLEDAARFAGEVLLALEHLHGIRVIFRDLKLENVVTDYNYRAKVTDFGLAKKLYAGSDANTMCGSYGYAAPEIMLNTGRYTYAVDLYSYGVMLYMLVSGGETSQRSPAPGAR